MFQDAGSSAILMQVDTSSITVQSNLPANNTSFMAETLITAERNYAFVCEEKASLVKALEYERLSKVSEVRALQLAQAALVRTISTERQVKEGEIKALRAEICSLANFIRSLQQKGRDRDSRLDASRVDASKVEGLLAHFQRRKQALSALLEWASVCFHRKRQIHGVMRFLSRNFTRAALLRFYAWRVCARHAAARVRLVELACGGGTPGEESLALFHYGMRSFRLALLLTRVERLRVDELVVRLPDADSDPHGACDDNSVAGPAGAASEDAMELSSYAEALSYARRRARRFQARLRRTEEDVRCLHSRVRFLESRTARGWPAVGDCAPRDEAPCSESGGEVESEGPCDPPGARCARAWPAAGEAAGGSRGNTTTERVLERCAAYFFESGSLSISADSTLSLSCSTLSIAQGLRVRDAAHTRARLHPFTSPFPATAFPSRPLHPACAVSPASLPCGGWARGGLCVLLLRFAAADLAQDSQPSTVAAPYKVCPRRTPFACR